VYAKVATARKAGLTGFKGFSWHQLAATDF
jgi:hypothetical protein